jgi:hypothetical protein
VECRFEGEPKRLELRLEHVRGQHFECPQCGTLCGVHDTIERRWRHLNFFGVPLRVGGQGAAHLVWQGRGVSGAGALGAENSSLLLMVEGRSAEALGAFANALCEHGGDPSQIEGDCHGQARTPEKKGCASARE